MQKNSNIKLINVGLGLICFVAVCFPLSLEGWRAVDDFLDIEIRAQSPSRVRQILTVCAHVDRSLNPHGTPNLCRKQFGTILNASPSVYDRKISKNIEK